MGTGSGRSWLMAFRIHCPALYHHRSRWRIALLFYVLLGCSLWWAKRVLRDAICEPDYKLETGGYVWGGEHDYLVRAIADVYRPRVNDGQTRDGSYLGCSRKEDFLVVDVGVNTGAITLRAAQLGAQVIGFEAIPSNAETVSKRLKLNHYDARVKLLNVAAGNESSGFVYAYDNYYERVSYWGPALFGISYVISQKNGFVASENEKHDLEKQGKTLVQVPIRQIDDEISLAKDMRVVLFKIDVEGFEYQVISGAQKMFSSRQVDLVHSEFSPKSMDKWQSGRAVEYLQRFMGWGYRVFVEDCSHNIDDETRDDLLPKLSVRCASSDGDSAVLELLQACKSRAFDRVLQYEISSMKLRPVSSLLLRRESLVNLLMC